MADHWQRCAQDAWQTIDRLRTEIANLEAEIDRLREGRLTEEEFQNLCHNFSAEDQARFKAGCREYQRCLFGDAWVDDLADLRAVQARLLERIGIMSEVLSRAAERGKVCGKCLRELTREEGDG